MQESKRRTNFRFYQKEGKKIQERGGKKQDKGKKDTKETKSIKKREWGKSRERGENLGMILGGGHFTGWIIDQVVAALCPECVC